MYPVRVLPLAGEAQEGGHRVASGAEDEHEGGAVVHVLVKHVDVHRGVLDEAFAHVLYHKVSHRKHHL